MYTLVILKQDPKHTARNILESVDVWVTLWTNEEEPSEAACYWLDHFRDDIVMIVEIETGICKHCETPIHEDPSWVLYKWVHNHTGARTCRKKGLTRAEPKENT